MVAYFARRTFDPETAVDLVAETFAAAFRDRARCRGSTDEEALPWLYGIARHQLANFYRRGAIEGRALRKLGVERRGLTDPEYERIEELAGLADLRGRVARELQELSAEHALVLRLRILEELDYPEIAARLDITEQTARTRVSRGLKRLAARLDETFPGEVVTDRV